MYEGICATIRQELDELDEKYDLEDARMTAQDLDHIDKMFHALKCLKTYEAMTGEPRRRSKEDYKRY